MSKRASVRDVIPYSSAFVCLILFCMTIESMLMTEDLLLKEAIFEVEKGFNPWDFKDRNICTRDTVCSKVPKHMFDFLQDDESISIFRGEFSNIPYSASSSKGKVTFVSVLFGVLVFLAVVPLWRVWREDELTSVISLVSQGVLIVYISEYVLGT